MINVYVRPAAIKGCVGRVDYLINPERQENIVAIYSTNSDFNFWQALAEHTDKMAREAGHKNTCQAREWHGALPNELYYQYKNNPEELVKKISDIFKRLTDTDNIVVLHWNKKRTNFHFHAMCSENKEINEIEYGSVLTRKTYYNELGKRSTKKECIDKNGDLKKDCKVYEKGSRIETIKRFGSKEDLRSKELNKTVKEEMANFFNQETKQNLYKVYKSDELHFTMQKEYKGMPAEQIADIKQENNLKREWNQAVDEALTKQVPAYMIKEEKEACITKNKLNLEFLRIAIDKIKDTAKFVYNKLLNGLNKILEQEKATESLKKEYLSIKDKLFVSRSRKEELLKTTKVANQEMINSFNKFKEKNPILFDLLKKINNKSEITPSLCLDYLSNNFRSDYIDMTEPNNNNKETIEKGENKSLSYIKNVKNKPSIREMLKEINDEIDNFYDLDEIIGNNSFEKRINKRKRDDYER